MKRLFLGSVLFLLSSTVGCIYVSDGDGFDGFDHGDDDLIRRADIDDLELLSNGGDPVFIATVDARLDDDASVELDSITWESDDGASSLTFEPDAVEILDVFEDDGDRHEVRYRGALGLTIDDAKLCNLDGELSIRIRAVNVDDEDVRTLRDDVSYRCD